MSDVLSFAEIDGQHVELLPARTVLSVFNAGGGGGRGGNGGEGGTGGVGRGGLGLNLLNINLFGDQTNSAGGPEHSVRGLIFTGRSHDRVRRGR